MQMFSFTNPILPTVLALGTLACTPAPAEKSWFQPLPPPIADEARVPMFGPGKPVVTGMSPAAIAVSRDVAYIVGMGELFALRGGALDPFAHEETFGAASDVAAIGDQVFVADGRSGLTSFAIDGQGHPQRQNHWTFPGECYRVAASEHGVAALCLPRWLMLVRPGHPPESMPLPGVPNHAAWIDQSIFLACPGDGLVRVDINKPGPPVIYDHEKLDRIVSVTALGSRLFVGLRDKRVLELDPATAKAIGEVTVLNPPMRIIAGKNQLLVASMLRGDIPATWIDVSKPGELRVSGSLPFSVSTGAYLGDTGWMVVRPEGPLSMVANDGRIVAQNKGVRFERLAMGLSQNVAWAEERAAKWTWIGEQPDISFAEGKLVDAAECGQALCTLESSGHVCRQGSGATEPDCLDIPQGGTSLAWQSLTGILWVIDSTGVAHGLSVDSGLREVATIARVHTASPQDFGRFVIEGEHGVAVDVNFGILQVFDLGKSPRLRGRFLLHGLPKAVALVNDVVFVAEPRGGLQISSIAQPDAPREIAWQAFDAGPFGVAARRDEAGRTIVVLAEGEKGISFWRWDDASHKLEMVRRADTRGFASDVVFDGSNAFVADGASVLRFAWSELAP